MSVRHNPEAGARRKRAPGRPRDASYDATILREVLREISAHGIKRFSVQRVADSAGVAKATVRLRWPDRDELIMAGLATLTSMITRPSTGSLRGDLEHIVSEYAEVYRTEEIMRLFSYVQAEQNDSPAFLERYQSIIGRPANQIVLDAISQAQDRGEVRDDVDVHVVARLLVGSLYLEGIAAHGEITAYFEEAVIDLIVAAIVTRPASLRPVETSSG